MTENPSLDERIERAAETVGSVWPAHSFVTANPLSGFEDRPFHRAVREAESLFGGRGYPEPSVFRRAWEEGRIDPDVLAEELAAHGFEPDPERSLDELAANASDDESDSEPAPETETLDRLLSKWLAAFLDEGRAAWPMPGREDGFYAAWRSLAPYDSEIPDGEALPETASDALTAALEDVPDERVEETLEHHLAALPGWTGYIKQRATGDGNPWQSEYPVSLADYLAVRLTLADLLGAPIEPEEGNPEPDDEIPLAECWLTAWEKSYRQRLLGDIRQSVPEASTGDTADESGRPDAQLVFCIDTRSEVIRRHIEAQGSYETHGYAGFFGVPMRYQAYDADTAVDACPPIVDAQYRVSERPASEHGEEAATHDRWRKLVSTGRKHLKGMKQNVAAAFTFVEGAGGAYGAAMATRTLLPSAVRDAVGALDDLVPDPAAFCEPTLDRRAEADGGTSHEHDGEPPQGMTLGERVACAETAFELMGIEEFARLVVFTGHASETANNPFGSALDCGACAGNPGGPNARALAAICNDEAVRTALRERGHEIPEDTVFLAAEHNTTTDGITLFDGDVPASHRADLESLRGDLDDARAAAASERAESLPGSDAESVEAVERRAADWAETRPEWGLAGNASFVIGPRALSADADLDGRAFLHSYDWTSDPEGESLEAILTGPLVVTQWINSQYYFASVDNAVYGSGSKTTQNPVGNVGVRQGNGGDLMGGLPKQSLYVDDETLYHQPLRLTAVVHAPVERVEDILRRNPSLAGLLDNGWIQLTVLDPAAGRPVHYAGELEWTPVDETETVGSEATSAAPSAAD